MYKLIILAMSSLVLGSCGNNSEPVQKQEQISIHETQIEPKEQTASKELTNTVLISGIDLQYIDESVRPQDDFYRYVNGKWLNEYVLPADKSRYGSFGVVHEKSERDVQSIIDELSINTYEKDTGEQKISDLYKSYMDIDSINKAGVSVLTKDFTKINSIKTYDDLMAYMSYADIYSKAPFGLYVEVDLKNSSQYITYVSQSGLGLPEKDYYINQGDKFKNIRSKYLTLIENMFTLAKLENPKQSAQTIMDIESKIADAHWTNVENRDTEKSYNLKSYEEFKALMPSLNIDSWMQGTRLSNVSQIVVSQPDYLIKLDSIIASTSIEDWRIYFYWKLINRRASQMSKEFDDENFKFYGTILRGTTEQKARWKRAIATVNGSVGELVGQVYVKSFFPPSAKSRMNNMIENLRGAYGESIKQLDWMSPETKLKAQDKLNKFDPKVGYPDEWRDYSKLHIAKSSLFDNMIAVTTWQENRGRSKLGKPVDKNEWGMSPQTVNAYYNPTKNEIVFPAAILQPPFFNLEADNAVNYGGIGAVIGHEMGHGFDDQGSLYDGDGNLKGWWTDSDREKFNAKTALLIEQYNNFTVLDGTAHVNGELTQGENIGDLSGISIAYKAFKKAYPDNQTIDELSSDERFFFGWAQVWRGKMRDEAMLQKVANGPHSPAEFRVNGPLRNFPPFLELYKVKEGDKMFLPPDKQVKIW